MASENVLSPPYPGEGTTASHLWGHVHALCSWVNKSRGEVNDHCKRALVGEVVFHQTQKVFAGQSVVAQFRALALMRRVRESWDHLIRQFEGDWDSPECLVQRAMLLSAASHCIEDLHKSFELREAEARKQGYRETINKTFEHLYGRMVEFMEPEHGQGFPDVDA